MNCNFQEVHSLPVCAQQDRHYHCGGTGAALPLVSCQLIMLLKDLLDRVPNYVPICADKEWNFDELLETVWARLDMIRVFVETLVADVLMIYRYTKPRGQIPDYDQPVVLPRSSPPAACLHRLELLSDQTRPRSRSSVFEFTSLSRSSLSSACRLGCMLH